MLGRWLHVIGGDVDDANAYDVLSAELPDLNKRDFVEAILRVCGKGLSRCVLLLAVALHRARAYEQLRRQRRGAPACSLEAA